MICGFVAILLWQYHGNTSVERSTCFENRRWPIVKKFVIYPSMASIEAHFCDYYRNMEHFLFAVVV